MEPYVFFRLDVVVPAPRFTQRPTTECPTKPSWALFAYPRKTVLWSSPRTLLRRPMLQRVTSPPNTSQPGPTYTGPSNRVPPLT